MNLCLNDKTNVNYSDVLISLIGYKYIRRFIVGKNLKYTDYWR